MSEELTISREATTISMATETIAIIDRAMENHAGSQMMAVSDMVNVVLDIRSLMTRLLNEMPRLQQEDSVA
jgi:hypothetical protein